MNCTQNCQGIKITHGSIRGETIPHKGTVSAPIVTNTITLRPINFFLITFYKQFIMLYDTPRLVSDKIENCEQSSVGRGFSPSTSVILPFLVWHHLPTHCRCTGLLLHLLTLSDTTHLVGLLWTSGRPVTETSAWHQTKFTRETSMPPAEFKPAIPASERPQTHALDCEAISITPIQSYSTCISYSFAHHRRYIDNVVK
jgi:hypothetical protein